MNTQRQELGVQEGADLQGWSLLSLPRNGEPFVPRRYGEGRDFRRAGA